MTLSQVAPVRRPRGEVELKCSITGISLDEIQYYWWLLYEKNAPIYTFSVRDIMKNISFWI